MDTRQWIEPPGVSASILPPWTPLLSNGHNVVIPWSGHDLFYSQPQPQDFTPEHIGVPWTFGIQNLFDQSTGVVTAFPQTLRTDYDEHRNATTPVTPTLNIGRSLSCLVPQRRYTSNRRGRSVRDFKPQPPIIFETYFGHNFSMKDALDKDFKSLMKGGDSVLPNGTAVSLRFEFKGYESWTCQVKTRDSRKIPHPIPRAKLAHEVAKKLLLFLQKRRVRLDETDFLGEGEITLSSINIENLVLVRLDHVSKASWQPQFMIV